jgi:hypothetical protein
MILAQVEAVHIDVPLATKRQFQLLLLRSEHFPGPTILLGAVLSKISELAKKAA